MEKYELNKDLLKLYRAEWHKSEESKRGKNFYVHSKEAAQFFVPFEQQLFMYLMEEKIPVFGWADCSL